MSVPVQPSTVADALGRQECRVRRPPEDLLPAESADAIAAMLKVLAEPARLRILHLIKGSQNVEACVCELVGPLGLAQSTVSHHLKVLYDAGFLQRERRGTWAYYRLAPGPARSFETLLSGARALAPMAQ